jgi:hypothetical protein
MSIRESNQDPIRVPDDAGAGQTLTVSLASIRQDERFQAREGGVNPAIVAEYAEACRTTTLPPPRCVRIGGGLVLVDGFHTIAALRDIGATDATVVVSEGSEADAFLLAAGANATHGVRRTPADTKRAVALALRGLIAKGEKEMSNRRLAAIVGVDEATVRRYLPEVERDDPELCGTAAQRTVRSRVAVEREAGKAAAETTMSPPALDGARSEGGPTPEPTLERPNGDPDLVGEPPEVDGDEADNVAPPATLIRHAKAAKPMPRAKPVMPIREPREPEAADRTLAEEVCGRLCRIRTQAQGLRAEVDDLLQFYAPSVFSKMLARADVGGSWTAAITEMRDCAAPMEAMLGPELGGCRAELYQPGDTIHEE